MTEKMEQYFIKIQEDVDKCYEIAEKARQKGLDPELFVESPQAKDLAGRVEKLVGPNGIAALIRNLKNTGKSDDEIVFQVVSEILDQNLGNINSLEERVERAIRAGLAIKTMGVVSAPLEGISKILIRKDHQGNSYLSLYFAGPIRAAGGTTAALCVLVADYVREKSNIPRYEATEAEVGRYVEEVKLYDRRVHLQYPSSNDEIRYAVQHLPIEINGDSTENEEVSAFRNLPRVETNNIRGGACLVLNDGILLKAPKLLKIAKSMNLKNWDWLENLKKIAQKELKDKEKDNSDKNIITPNSKYISDIIAGRPVFSHPSRMGGHRIRYGRSRNTGLAAGGLHPATMGILDNFVAVGTQLRIERPGKSTSICPVDGIEPPIVRLKNGDVIQIRSYKMAQKIFPEVEKILFLGDILFGFGEFAENNHILVPSGYVEEWWVKELEKAIGDSIQSNNNYENYIRNPFENIPPVEEAVIISKKFNVPLHPRYTDYWNNLTLEELEELRNALLVSYDPSDKSIKLNFNPRIKSLLEKAFVLHKVENNKILLKKTRNYLYPIIFDLDRGAYKHSNEAYDHFSYFFHLSGLQLRNKAPYYMGTRMGRPEKSERKSMKGIHSLFPLSEKVGNTRLVETALELEKVKVDICRKKCPKCGKVTIFNKCDNCGTHTEICKVCQTCKKLYRKSEEKCSKCGNNLSFSSEATIHIKNHINSALNRLNTTVPKKMKGIFGLTNKFKVPEPIEKGILRAQNGLLVYKTAEIRYDATDIPLTHFKPKEINLSIDLLKKMGYNKDYKDKDITSPNQIVELKVQDIVISKDCADYFVRLANFLDDELDYFYGLERFYKVQKREDLIGHLAVGLAPHTSAGIIGRIIGFSPVRSIYAHPFWHAAKRRNADGDEDGIMLLLDPLLNFSRFYLPSKIGGRMDATLVISTKLDPNEIDVEAHNIDTRFDYPLEFYEATLESYAPNKIERIMQLVKSRLGSPEQYENIGFNIPTSNINDGPLITAYKTHKDMADKIESQLYLGKIINAVDAKNVAEKVLSTHFNPDILGNLRKFSLQEFRCVKCNEKYRRPPLSNGGKCSKCGNKVILTVNRGGIEKYVPRALKICKDFDLNKYTMQRMELIEQYVISLTNNPKIKQQKLADFF